MLPLYFSQDIIALSFSIASRCITEMKLVLSGQPASVTGASPVLHEGEYRCEAKNCHDSKATLYEGDITTTFGQGALCSENRMETGVGNRNFSKALSTGPPSPRARTI
jgi:hypothetical protein